MSSRATLTRPVAPPGPVVASFWLWRIECLLAIVTGLGTIVAGLLAQYLIPDDQPAATVTTTATLLALGLLIIGIAISGMVLTRLMESGKRWARVVLTLSGIAAVGIIAPGIRLLPLVGIGLATAIAIALMYVPASNVYFRRAPFEK